MEFSTYPVLLLQNAAAVVISLFLTILLRVRWLVTLLAWAGAIGLSFVWKGIGYSWQHPWHVYFYDPVLGGGLWRGPVTKTEIVGLLLFWLLPLAFAYAVARSQIPKRRD